MSRGSSDDLSSLDLGGVVELVEVGEVFHESCYGISGLSSGSNLATERRESGSACEPVAKQAPESDTEVSCPNLLIPSSESPKVVVTGVLGDTTTSLRGTVVLVNEVMPSWLVLLGGRVSLMNTHHWTHREVGCFRRSLSLPKCGFEYSSEDAFLHGQRI